MATKSTKGTKHFSGRAWPGIGYVWLLLFVWTALKAETITIATYNVQNYGLADRMVEGTFRQAYPKPETEKKALRAVIRTLDADVIALQEIGPKSFLEELQRDLAADGVKYPYAELLEAADEERHVAILSRRPFASVGRHTDLTFSYFKTKEPVKRGLLEVRFKMESGELTLFVVHLKSRFTDRDDDPLSAQRRLGEAVAVRDRVLKLFPEPTKARFILMGDCNDSGASRPLRSLMKRGEAEIFQRVPATDSRGEVWTHFYRKEQTYSAVDHVLISPALKTAVVTGTATICDSSEVLEASDHRPVVVKLKWEK
ncbi:MAG: endonuclease/exonuclease/phosphatase family protein [Nibricoccus sp.]